LFLAQTRVPGGAKLGRNAVPEDPKICVNAKINFTLCGRFSQAHARLLTNSK
jgi:hypothetical protein